MCRFLKRAPLLPKLRGHFAEFLRHGSLKRPSILYLFTCVGLGYGHHREESPPISTPVFAWKLPNTYSYGAVRSTELRYVRLGLKVNQRKESEGKLGPIIQFRGMVL